MFSHLIVDEASDAVGNGTVPIQHGLGVIMFSCTSLPRLSSLSPAVVMNLCPSMIFLLQNRIFFLHCSLIDELLLIELDDFLATCLVPVLQGQGDVHVLVCDIHTCPPSAPRQILAYQVLTDSSEIFSFSANTDSSSLKHASNFFSGQFRLSCITIVSELDREHP